MARTPQLELAWQLIADKAPKYVLELGSGMSTLVMAYALESAEGGHLTALEDIPTVARNTRELLSEHGLSQYARVIDAPLTSLELEGKRHTYYDMRDLPRTGSLILYSLTFPRAFWVPRFVIRLCPCCGRAWPKTR